MCEDGNRKENFWKEGVVMALNLRRANQAYGLGNALQNVPPEPVRAQRAPETNDFALPGTIWLDQSSAGNDVYILLKVEDNTASWISIGSGSGTFDTLTVTGDATIGGELDVENIASANPISIVTTSDDNPAITIGADSDGSIVVFAGFNGLALGSSGSVFLGSERNVMHCVTINTTAGNLLSTILMVNTAGTRDDSIEITSFDGGVIINGNAGNISLVPGTNSAAAAAITLDKKIAAATFTGLTTASAATETFTITNSNVSATSSIIVTVSNVGTNDAQMTLTQVKPAAGSFEVLARNNGAAALNGDVIISWIVLN